MSTPFTKPGALVPDVISAKTTDATVKRFTSSNRIWSARPLFTADPSNTDEVLIGYELADGSVPTDIVKSGAGATEVNAIKVLVAGQDWEPPVQKYVQAGGEQFQLKKFVYKSASVDQVCTILRVKRGFGEN